MILKQKHCVHEKAGASVGLFMLIEEDESKITYIK